jgi:hypothetical protein
MRLVDTAGQRLLSACYRKAGHIPRQTIAGGLEPSLQWREVPICTEMHEPQSRRIRRPGERFSLLGLRNYVRDLRNYGSAALFPSVVHRECGAPNQPRSPPPATVTRSARTNGVPSRRTRRRDPRRQVGMPPRLIFGTSMPSARSWLKGFMNSRCRTMRPSRNSNECRKWLR